MSHWFAKPGSGELQLALVRKGATEAEHKVVEWIENPAVPAGLLEKENVQDYEDWKPAHLLTIEEYAARIKHIAQDYPEALDHVNGLIRSHQRLEKIFCKTMFAGALEGERREEYEFVCGGIRGVHGYLKRAAIGAKQTYMLVGKDAPARTLSALDHALEYEAEEEASEEVTSLKCQKSTKD